MEILQALAAVPEVCAAGACPVQALRLGEREREWLARLCPEAKTVLPALFPYFAGNRPGNLSLYARGRDYHTVIREALSPLTEALARAYPENRFVVLADDSPIPEVRAAALAGLGMLGENGLLLHETYGSYVFIGTIVTDLDLHAAAKEIRPCLRCGACRAACPGGAIDETGAHPERCLSALTQRGGALTGTETEALRLHPLIWGCDRCQTVCPLNRGVPLTASPAFRTGLIDSLTPDTLSGLTRRAFAEKYPNRAFTWKGPAPLRRNLSLKTEDDHEKL